MGCCKAQSLLKSKYFAYMHTSEIQYQNTVCGLKFIRKFSKKTNIMSKSITAFTIYIIFSVLSLGSCTKGDQYSSILSMDEPSPTNIDDNTQGSHDIPLQEVFKTKIEEYKNRFGEPQITLQKDEQDHLCVTINTQQLRVTSVSKPMVNNYQDYLFGNEKVMAKYGTQTTKNQEYTQDRINTWVNRWNANNPFAGLAVLLKHSQQEEEFLGHVILGGGDEANCSELAYMIREDKWNQGYGYEATGALVLFLGPEIVKRGYKLPNGQTFKYIVATAREDNIPSVKILHKLGFVAYMQTEKYGHPRDHYKLTMHCP